MNLCVGNIERRTAGSSGTERQCQIFMILFWKRKRIFSAFLLFFLLIFVDEYSKWKLNCVRQLATCKRHNFEFATMRWRQTQELILCFSFGVCSSCFAIIFKMYFWFVASGTQFSPRIACETFWREQRRHRTYEFASHCDGDDDDVHVIKADFQFVFSSEDDFEFRRLAMPFPTTWAARKSQQLPPQKYPLNNFRWHERSEMNMNWCVCVCWSGCFGMCFRSKCRAHVWFNPVIQFFILSFAQLKQKHSRMYVYKSHTSWRVTCTSFDSICAGNGSRFITSNRK